MTKPDLGAAAQFLAASGRVLDRRTFQRLFEGGGAGPVRDAIAAYRNPDGGFGHDLEPDGRCPDGQPAAIELALRTLDEADAWGDDLVSGACGWLQANAPAGGGAAFAESSVERWPHAPWQVPEAGRPATLISTGQIAGTLHARGRSTRGWIGPRSSSGRGSTCRMKQPPGSVPTTCAACCASCAPTTGFPDCGQVRAPSQP